MPVTLSDDDFAMLYEYLDREHTITWDPNTVGQTTKIGKKLWDRVQEIAEEQGFGAPAEVG
jgi:hypothetical protein